MSRPYTRLTPKILSDYLQLHDDGSFYWTCHQGRGNAGQKAGSRRADGTHIIRLLGKAYRPDRLKYFIEHNGRWPKRQNSEATRLKISASKTGVPLSEAHKEKIRLSRLAKRAAEPYTVSTLTLPSSHLQNTSPASISILEQLEHPPQQSINLRGIGALVGQCLQSL